MIIETGSLHPNSLAEQVAVITGAGRGIGLETARSLLWLGANVVIAEVDDRLAAEAGASLGTMFNPERVLSVPTDVGDEAEVKRLATKALKRFGQVDIIINNATITPMGAVWNVPVGQWDHSYRVNLRGPVLLARQFIPAMRERDYGVFVCVSSVGQAYMGAYECYKTAQVHLAETLDAELENTGVHAFAIGPGLVRTPGADAGIRELAPLYGLSVEDFYELGKDQIVSVEEAGAGFAAAVVLAGQFRGQEISSRKALLAAGITPPPPTVGPSGDTVPKSISDDAGGNPDSTQALTLCRQIKLTLEEQSTGWSKRSLFERQWMFRDFKKNAGMPVDQWLETLSRLETSLLTGNLDRARTQQVPLDKLAGYYRHLIDLARGYERDPVKADDQAKIVQAWADEADSLAALLN